MSMRFTQLQCKEVICVKDGRRLGFVEDVVVDTVAYAETARRKNGGWRWWSFVEDVVVEVPEGNIRAIVVPGPCRFLGVAGRNEDFVIPWNCICRIGPDTVLVDTKPDDCRVRRQKPGPRFGNQ